MVTASSPISAPLQLQVYWYDPTRNGNDDSRLRANAGEAGNGRQARQARPAGQVRDGLTIKLGGLELLESSNPGLSIALPGRIG